MYQQSGDERYRNAVFTGIKNMILTMVRQEEGFQVTNTFQEKVLTVELSYVQWWNICSRLKNFMKYSETTDWLTGLSYWLSMHYLVLQLLICGLISTISNQTRYWLPGKKENGVQMEIIQTFTGLCPILPAAWQICIRDGQSLQRVYGCD